MNALETPSKPLQERSPRSSVYENGGRLLVSKRNFVEEDQSPSQRQSSQVSPTLQSQDDSGTKVSQLPYITRFDVVAFPLSLVCAETGTFQQTGTTKGPVVVAPKIPHKNSQSKAPVLKND